jgi:hypothetical protein
MDPIFTLIRSLNLHLPTKRKTLSELLKEKDPSIKGRDGTDHYFKKTELEYLAKLVPKKFHHSLKLPIYIEISTDYESGTYRIRGLVEGKVINKILEREENNLDEMETPMIFIYRPELQKIRRLLPTTTQYIFITHISE